jgi:murein L,D-transpeptidase YafK
MKSVSIYIKIAFRILFLLIFFATVYYLYPEQKLPEGIEIDKIKIYKSKRHMVVFSDNKKLKTYTISLGFRPIGKKRFEGDGRTPEGKYHIISKNKRSIAYKSFGISYPNNDDLTHATKRGRLAGGNIMIHGIMNDKGYWGKFHRFIDWTGGCIALTNYEMDDLFKHLNVGCEIEIYK